MKVSVDGTLECPICHESCGLHHKQVEEQVEVFERTEDATDGMHVTILSPFINTNPSIRITQSLEGNPSSRRNGLIISFWCEVCNQTSELIFAQHKGATFTSVSQNLLDFGILKQEGFAHD